MPRQAHGGILERFASDGDFGWANSLCCVLAHVLTAMEEAHEEAKLGFSL